MNITRTQWVTVPSLPIPDTTYLKKRTTVSSQNPTLQTPSSPKHPGTDVREDPPHQKSCEITVEYDHKALLPPTKSEHDATLRALLGSFRHKASTLVASCPSHFKFAQEPFFFPSYVRRVDPSPLGFSLSSHRHSYIGLLLSSRFIT